MAMSRRRNQRAVSPFGDLMDALNEDPWQTFWGRRADAPSAPAVDVRESPDAYVIEADMPGVKPEDLEVTLEGRTLVIRGRYGAEREEEEGDASRGRWIVRERRSGTYARAITLPEGIDADNIKSTFENGELQLTLPKAQERRARRIPIGGGAEGARSVGSGQGSQPGDGSMESGQG